MLTCQITGDTLGLAGNLQVHYLDTIQACLHGAMGQSQPLTVDVSGVVQVDLAGLQLLLAFLRTRQAVAHTSLAGTPPFMVRAMGLSGLEEHFAAFTS